jgi:hypothetical protein
MSDRIDPKLLREYADGELTDERSEALSRRLQEDDAAALAGRAAVLNQRRLREHVSRAMTHAAAPQHLRDAVVTMLATGAPESTNDAARDESPVARIDRTGVTHMRPASSWRMRTLLAAPQRANLLAIAAVLALISGVVLYGIFAPTIDETRVREPSASDLLVNAAEYADGVHGECTVNAERLQNKAEWRSEAQAESNLTEFLHTPVQVINLSSLGYDFVGAGRSGLPFERVPSGHLIYRKSLPNGKTAGMVSVFVAPTTGCCKKMCAKLKPREWTSSESSRCTHRVLCSTDRKLIYFLVCCDERDLEPVAGLIARASGGG